MAQYGLVAVYILANRKQGTLYTGVASDLPKRMEEHQSGVGSRFAKTHGCNRLVWFEVFQHMDEAIAHEKRLKRWNRAWKIELIEKTNPDWRDLTLDL